MKITKSELRKIIREEIRNLNEKHGKIPGFSEYANLSDPFYITTDREDEFMAKVEARAAELGLLDDLYKGVEKYHFGRKNHSNSFDPLEMKQQWLKGIENRITKHGKLNKNHVRGMKTWIKQKLK